MPINTNSRNALIAVNSVNDGLKLNLQETVKWCGVLILFLGGIAESDSAYCDICYSGLSIWPSVSLYVCRLSHLCTLLKLLDGMRWHLAGTLMLDGPQFPYGKGRFGG